MSQRPTFWIHRTRLFWFGLAMLVVLTVVLMVSCCSHFEIRREAATRGSAGRSHITLQRMGYQEGCLYWRRSAGWSGWSTTGGADWAHSLTEHYGFWWLPKVSWDEWGNGSQRVFIPIWPLIVLWCFLWPWWMHRSEKKMVERYRKMGGALVDD